MPEVRQSSTNPAYPRLAHNLAIAICMVDRNVIEFDKEYSCIEFADIFNKIHINMNVCGNLLGHALIEFSDRLFKSDRRIVPWSLIKGQKKASLPKKVDTLELPERTRCFTFRVLADYSFDGGDNPDLAKRASFCYVELMKALDLSLQLAVTPAAECKEGIVKRRRPYDDLSKSWKKKVARTHVKDAASEITNEHECEEGVALEMLKDIFSGCAQEAPSGGGDENDWSRLSQLGLDQERMDEMASDLGVKGNRKYSDKEKTEMASMFAKARGEAELNVNFRSLEEKYKRSVVATAVVKTLSKRKAYATLKNRTLLRIVDQQSRSSSPRSQRPTKPYMNSSSTLKLI